MWFVLKLDSADHALQSLAAKVELGFGLGFSIVCVKYVPAKRVRERERKRDG